MVTVRRRWHKAPAETGAPFSRSTPWTTAAALTQLPAYHGRECRKQGSASFLWKEPHGKHLWATQFLSYMIFFSFYNPLKLLR